MRFPEKRGDHSESAWFLNRECQLTDECQPVGIKPTILSISFDGALVSDQTATCGSLPIIFMPKRSAASAEVLSRKVTGKPSFFHVMSPPSRTQTFEMPFFRSATATRALVNSPDEEQYRTSLIRPHVRIDQRPIGI